MARCILKGAEITPENDSKAHVIPSALGGTLKPKGLLCRAANLELAEKFDLLLITAFQPIMALVGGVPDRGQLQPTELKGPDGKRYLLAFGQRIEMKAPEYSEVPTETGIQYSITARTLKEARTLLGRVVKDNPHLDVDELLSKAVHTETYLSHALRGQLKLGDAYTFPAIFGMAAIYAAHCGVSPHPEFKNYVDSFPDDGKEILESLEGRIPIPPDTFYWMPNVSPFEESEGVTHRIFLATHPEKGVAFFHVELFNLIRVGVKIPYAGEARSVWSYGVDVLTGVAFDPTPKEAVIYGTEWVETHQMTDESWLTELLRGLSHMLLLVQFRSLEQEFRRILREELANKEGGYAGIGARTMARIEAVMEAQLSNIEDESAKERLLNMIYYAVMKAMAEEYLQPV